MADVLPEKMHSPSEMEKEPVAAAPGADAALQFLRTEGEMVELDGLEEKKLVRRIDYMIMP